MPNDANSTLESRSSGSAWLEAWEKSPTRARRRRRQGGGQLRGGARVREAPRSSQAAAAAGGQAVQPQGHGSGGRSRARSRQLAASTACTLPHRPGAWPRPWRLRTPRPLHLPRPGCPGYGARAAAPPISSQAVLSAA